MPTPIGNLEDITFRAVRILREASAIVAEDTRHTRKLLTRYDITTPVFSYHQHNKRARIPAILDVLRTGDVALVSSAGMPSISDPGFELLRAAIDHDITIDVLPGPTAVATAVVGAAIPAPGFLFLGFLPRRAGERTATLRGVASLSYALVLYEAPHRLLATLRALLDELGNREVVAARELTKIHQEYVRGTLTDLLSRFTDEPPRGEFTLVLAGAALDEHDTTPAARRDIERRRAAGQDARTAVAEVTATYGLNRNAVYRLWLDAVGAANHQS